MMQSLMRIRIISYSRLLMHVSVHGKAGAWRALLQHKGVFSPSFCRAAVVLWTLAGGCGDNTRHPSDRETRRHVPKLDASSRACLQVLCAPYPGTREETDPVWSAAEVQKTLTHNR